MADHARTTAFLISDGVVPSNEDRGYVLRRIIRRAVRFAYLLGVEQAVMPPMVERTVDVMGEAYPDLAANRDWVVEQAGREEEQFRRRLKTGMALLDEALDENPSTLSGSVAFKLHDTFGFPLEVTQEVAAERDVEVDLAGFEDEMAAQRARARGARKGADAGASVDRYRDILEQFGTTEFTGYVEDQSEGRVVAVLPADDGTVEVFLDRTPFYAESGGQVGDTGLIRTSGAELEVLDTTFALPGLHRMLARPVQGDIEVGQDATARIDVRRRDFIRRNHTGTHLLHWALREVLGEHVRQQGSLVAPESLRFDFSHFAAVTDDELAAVVDLANAEVLANESVRAYETNKEHAAEVGAIAFFGDKYGEVVRVVEAGRNSLELCGGTHVRRLGDIGPIQVLSEQSIGSNVRRIAATTGTATLDRIRSDRSTLAAVASLLGVPAGEVLEGLEKRLEEVRFLKHELAHVRQAAATGGADELAAGAVDGIVVARQDGGTRDDIKALAMAVRDKPGVKAVVLGGVPDAGGVALVATVAKDSGFNASELIADAAKAVGGGGGKSPDTAIAGGRDPSQLDVALDLARAAAGLPVGGA
jgi:alanyl-tRNA synthetase